MTTPERTDAFPPVIYVVIAVMLWSTGGLFIKLTTLDAYQVTFFRSLLAGITVLALTRRQGLRINAFGILTSIIYATLLFLFVWATKKTTAANAIFLQYTAPIYILILAPFVIGEKFHWRDLITVIFCIGGMSLFFVGKLEISDYQGNIAALFSGVFLGLYIMLLKHPRAVGNAERGTRNAESVSREAGDTSKASNPGRKNSAFRTPQSALSEDSAFRTPQSALSEDSAFRTPHSAFQKTNPAIAVIYGNFLLAIVTLPSGIAAVPVMVPLDWFSVTFLGVIQIGISYILFIRGVTGGTRPLDASIIGFIEPLLNPVWVFLFVGEQPSRWAILGGVIIIATVVSHTLVQYRSKPIPVTDS
jgi:drug/metabolite transporter (DMT)-like permease